MKVQSKLGITIPKTNLACCCSPSVYKSAESLLDKNLVLIPLGCVDFDIEWQTFDFGTDEWVLSQTGGEDYEWSGPSDVSLVRVKLSREGCCDVYSQAILYTE